ncbi:exodeoxyribonuclease VII large subunit [uncultured Prevotella sp.]|uniref:exodeoxyribonuclease VII large subunit n=1 Tax=uncultured Prevotella sp. TaxID=159272 RepID=UPI002584E284|nr:exodeoxyribonuclease VII large subunit [uncultured Prevotella sp.]
MDAYSLLELNSMVRQSIEHTMNQEYWVEAELSECRENRGHCFMELIQKEEHSNTPIARASAKCWQSTWGMIGPYFERTTGQPLHAGLKVRLQVYPQFHEAYGFSWIITDIDPTFTLGDMARRRQEIIRQLKEEGIFDLQKDLTLPLFCLNIAVISSQSAAGYGDFVNQLADSPYDFHTQLFPAIMQGEQVEESIIQALNAIYNSCANQQTSAFDCVVIIRGGGATADLSGFDALQLAENVAQYPLPIITGIGHDRDESILDMVSNTRVKTPTAAAQLLISHLDSTALRIDTCGERINTFFSLLKTREEARIAKLSSYLSPLIFHLLEREQHKLEMLEQRAKALDPALLLKRGYSITLHNGHLLRNAAEVKPGTELETRLEQGTIISIVK